MVMEVVMEVVMSAHTLARPLGPRQSNLKARRQFVNPCDVDETRPARRNVCGTALGGVECSVVNEVERSTAH